MTVFVWDGSSFDGHITVAQFQQAMVEGVVAFTHRLLRQTGEVDTYAAGNLTNARTAGMPLLGAYGVTYTGGGDRQDDLLIQLADQQVPWWRSFAGWFWQEDLEKWPTDPVAASLGISSATQLGTGSGRKVALYASHSQYGNQLTGWSGPLWNADYTSHAPGTVRAMYPGDNWRPSHGTWSGGWTAYSGREPDLLQFTSSATIGGLTTCDASAFRGTLDQLRALLTSGATQPIPTEATMFLAVDSAGQNYLCDGVKSVRISADRANRLAYGARSVLGPTVELKDSADGKNNPEWTSSPDGHVTGIRRLNWDAVWGPAVDDNGGAVPPAPISQDQLNAAVAAAVNAAAPGLTAQQVTDAVVAALGHLRLTVAS